MTPDAIISTYKMAHTIGITPLGGVNGDFLRLLYQSVSLFLVDGLGGLGGVDGVGTVGSVILPYILQIEYYNGRCIIYDARVITLPPRDVSANRPNNLPSLSIADVWPYVVSHKTTCRTAAPIAPGMSFSRQVHYQ